jgi:hypothetical protein
MSNDWHYRWNPQAYAGAGYAAVMIDFHGSTGYGQASRTRSAATGAGSRSRTSMKGLAAALNRYPFLDRTEPPPGRELRRLHDQPGSPGSERAVRCLVDHDGNIDERLAYFDTEELWFPSGSTAGRRGTTRRLSEAQPDRPYRRTGASRRS